MKIFYLGNSVDARKKINYVAMSFFVLKVDNFFMPANKQPWSDLNLI